jgi:hypothetical protein
MHEGPYRWFKIPRKQMGAHILVSGIAPAALTAVGIVAGLAALSMMATQHYTIGLVLFLLGRMTSALARDDGQHDTAFAFAADSVAYASVPFAFALADPRRALAAAFLLFGLVAAVAALSNRRGVGVADSAICCSAYAVACIFPDSFSLIAYALGVACFATAGIRVAGRRA